MLIGLDVELGDVLCNSFTNQAGEVNSQLSNLTGQVNNLLASWEGNSKPTFEGEWSDWVRQVQTLTSQMEDISRRLSSTLNSFRSADVF